MQKKLLKMEKKKEDMRLRILGAAQAVFLSNGYSNANMDLISSRAGVTKQTVYRYFGSKIELFQAMLVHLGKSNKGNFFEHLDHPDTETALCTFAKAFIRWHLSAQHIDIIRLLIAESGRNPKLVQVFFGTGPHNSTEELIQFFRDRLGIEHPESTVRMWTATLLAFRNHALLAMPPKTDQQIDEHAEEATRFLLAAVSQTPDNDGFHPV